MNNINVMLGLKLAANNIRKAVVQVQMQNNLSNEALCIILKYILVDFEAAATNDYATVLAQLIANSAEKEAREEAKEETKEEKEDADS